MSSLSLFFLGSSLSSSFGLLVHQPCNEETNTRLLTCNAFLFDKIGTRADATIHKAFACKCPSNNIYTVVEEWTHGCLLSRILLFLDTLLPYERAGAECVAAVFWFLRTILGWWRKLQRSPCGHRPVFFPLVTETFSSFNASDSLSFTSPMPGVNVSQAEFLIYAPLHHGFQLLIVGNRCLLMNLDVVQFQYLFKS